jgi:hypothetical protein
VSQDRRHHFVPAFYLAQFTSALSQEADLWVFDLEQNRSWKSTPRGAGHQRDFNRLDVPGLDPLAVEKDIFGTVESLAAPVIKGWCSRANGTLSLARPAFATTIDEISAVISFIAAQTIRVPQVRERIDRFNVQLARMVLDLTIESDASFAKAQEDNEHLRDSTREDVRELLRDPEFNISLDNAGYMQSLLPAMNDICELLALRSWRIVCAPSGGPDFICCDDPVVLLPPGAGFGMPGSTVCVPLSSRHVLWGGDFAPGRRPAPNVGVAAGSARSVAFVNGSIIRRSHRYLYAASQDFLWLENDGRIRKFADLRREHRAEARGRRYNEK